MILSSSTLASKRNIPVKFRSASIVALMSVSLVALCSCASSSDDTQKTSAAPQSLTTTLPTQEPVTLPEGYPKKLIPAMDDVAIRSGVFNKDQGSASLIFESGLEPEKIFGFYSDHFLGMGFAEVPKDDKLKDSLREFQRREARENASVAITTDTDGKKVTTVSVGGVPADDFN